MQVGNGVHPQTLMPKVVAMISVEASPDERTGYAFTPQQADQLADDLHRFAERARAQHWDPEGT